MRVLFTGTLCPCEKLPGCTFTVSVVSATQVKIVLRSAYGDKEIVDETICEMTEVAQWLEDRCDW